MSTSKWICAGIGVEQDDIIDMLDALKLAKRMAEDDDEYKELLEEGSDFMKMNNKDRLVELICFVNSNDELMELLVTLENDTYFVSANDFEDSHYLLYQRSYPWENPGDFKNELEVVDYMADFLLQFCIEGTKRESVIKKIDTDIYKVAEG